MFTSSDEGMVPLIRPGGDDGRHTWRSRWSDITSAVRVGYRRCI